MKKTAKLFAAILVTAFLIIAVGSFYTVRENQYAVVTQFGRIIKVNNNSGLGFRLPFVQSVSYLPKSVQLYDIAPSDVITMDKKSMIADNYIIWEITDPILFMKSLNGSIANAEDRASVAVYNATKNIISSMSQDDIISARGERLTQLVTEESNSDIGQYGIAIIQAEIKALDLPDDNKEAVYERMISERNNIAASYRAKGESDAQIIRNRTDREVSITLADAKKQAAILIAEGESTYMKTLQEAYNTRDKADFYNFIRALDALKASMTGNEKTVLLDKNSEIARILYGMDNAPAGANTDE